MGRRKIPPPEQTFQLFDRVLINSNRWGGETGVIKHIMLTGSGSYQEWVYYVSTHNKYYYKNNLKKTRFSIRT